MLREIAVALKNWHSVKEALEMPYNEEYDNFLCELLRLQKNCMCKISEDYSRVIVSYRGSTYAFPARLYYGLYRMEVLTNFTDKAKVICYRSGMRPRLSTLLRFYVAFVERAENERVNTIHAEDSQFFADQRHALQSKLNFKE